MTATLPPDPYKTLGVAQDAQIPEIRSAHRKLVLKCHPDKVQDPTLKAQKQDEFQRVQQAYELLSNDKERQRYDDQVRLAELRKQMQAKANSSTPRATPTYKFEIRTPEPRPSSFKSTSGTPPSAKFSRSYEGPSGAPMFEEVFTVRREKSYESKSSKRDDRERERDRVERTEKERERERRKKNKEAEEYLRERARKAEKKLRDKERKRADEEKKRHAKPYIEEDDVFEELRIREKKKSSKKHDEKRDRSAHREVPVNPVPLPQREKESHLINEATAYMKAKKSGLHHVMSNPPAAPTPPIPTNQSSPFPAPADEDDVRRSAAKSRRGSSGKKSSREVLSDPEIVQVSPSARYAQKTAKEDLSGSPPRRDLPRQNTMPADAYTRPIPSMPSMPRATTFSGSYPEAEGRGRNRSRMHPQNPLAESDSEGEYERRHRDRKHRSKKHRSPEPRAEYINVKYKVDGNRAIPHEKKYSHSYEIPQEAYSYYPANHPGVRVDTRSLPIREPSHRGPTNDYVPYKVKTSKNYDFADVSYSNHYQQGYYEEPSYSAY